MEIKNKFYSKNVVYKPWGHEYVVYNNANKIAVTFVYIKFGHKTSLHCHPQKKTGFIILDGKALVQVGIYKENKKKYKTGSRLVLRPGLFHSLEAVSKKGLCALEFETPYKKNDLLRFKDKYGRKLDDYEGKKYTKKISELGLVKFKKPKIGKINKYLFNNSEVSIHVIKKMNKIIKKDNKSTLALLEGNIIDEKGQNVISYGEIVKTKTLEIFCKNFKIKKELTVLKVSNLKKK